MEKKIDTDYSKLDEYGLFAYYEALTYNAWSYQHNYSRGYIEVSEKEFDKTNNDNIALIAPVYDEICKRYISSESGRQNESFGLWYYDWRAFASRLADSQIAALNGLLQRYVANGYSYEEYNKYLTNLILKYDKKLTENQNNNNEKPKMKS